MRSRAATVRCCEEFAQVDTCAERCVAIMCRHYVDIIILLFLPRDAMHKRGTKPSASVRLSVRHVHVLDPNS